MMFSSLEKLMHPPFLYAVLVAVVAAGAGIWLFLRMRRKSDAEREKERRLSVNSSGRMTDGVLTEALTFETTASDPLLLFYRYSIAGVEYSAAQDVSTLLDVVSPGTYLPGEAVTVKYAQHFPSNSIVICEQWSGLHRNGNSGSKVRDGGKSRQLV